MYADHTVLFSNFITIGSGNEGSEDDDTQKVDDKSDTTVTTTSDANNHAASNFQPTEKPKLQMKRKSAGKIRMLQIQKCKFSSRYEKNLGRSKHQTSKMKMNCLVP